MLIDTHAHLNFEAYNEDRGEVIERCLDYPMTVINIGAQYDTSKKAVELSENGNFYNTIGLHPIHVFDEEFNIQKYQKLITNKTVAIGETGLDYFHLKEKEKSLSEIIEKQKQIFIKHIELAKDNDLPLICHGRNSGNDFTLQTVYFDLLKILEQNNYSRGVMHCFGGKIAEAQSVIDAGMYIGFTGIITFPNAQGLRDVVAEMPLDRILIETDAPYLAPQKYRGERNEPIYVIQVAEKIAEIKNMKVEEVIEQVWKNAKKLFKIK
ncbi:TatD family hydrolase [bacterium]|nr:TatD family hydrolase [bacterium]